MKWQIVTIILVIGTVLICGCTQQPSQVETKPTAGVSTTQGQPATPAQEVTQSPGPMTALPGTEETLSAFEQISNEASDYYQQALELSFESWNSSGNMNWQDAKDFLAQARDKLQKAKETYQKASTLASNANETQFITLKSQAIMNMEKSLETDGKVLDESMKDVTDDDLIQKLSDESSTYYETASNLFDQAEDIYYGIPPMNTSDRENSLPFPNATQ